MATRRRSSDLIKPRVIFYKWHLPDRRTAGDKDRDVKYFDKVELYLKIRQKFGAR